jgi:hypothetical protein
MHQDLKRVPKHLYLKTTQFKVGKRSRINNSWSIPHLVVMTYYPFYALWNSICYNYVKNFCLFFETEAHYVTQAGFKLTILLPLLP